MPSRMKDSDDYLTARAANPRTGLISPSVCSPRGEPRTPGSPGEALALKIRSKVGKHGGEGDGSSGARPVLRRANEGRKISGGAVPWRTGGGGGGGIVGTAVSPKVTGVHAVAQSAACNAGADDSEDDKFIVKMPSAQEPQPYAFPGYSAKEIEAFEHYREKARRVSSEGYDKRILVGGRKVSGGEGRAYPVRAFSGDGIAGGRTAIPAPVPNRDVTVLKRRARMRDHVDHDVHHQQDGIRRASEGHDELSAATFAPFSSPKTPSQRAKRHGSVPATSLWTFAGSDEHDMLRHHQTAIPRKPLPGQKTKAGLRDFLPRVKLLHPTAAALPRSRASDRHDSTSACPLGCTKDTLSDSCLSSSSIGGDGWVPLFENDASSPSAVNTMTEPQQQNDGDQKALHVLAALTSHLVEGAMAMYHAISQIRPFLPALTIPALAPLHSKSAGPEEQTKALRTLLSTAGWAIGWVVAEAVVLRLWSLVIWALEVVFWPLSLAVRVGRWVVFGS